MSLKCCFQSLLSCWKAQSLAFFSSYRQKVNNWDYLTKTTFRRGLFLSSLLSSPSSASSSSPSSAVAVSGRRLWKIKSCRRPVDCKKPRDGVETVGDTRHRRLPTVCTVVQRQNQANDLQELLQLWSSRSLHSSCYLVVPTNHFEFLNIGFLRFHAHRFLHQMMYYSRILWTFGS